MVPVCGGAGGRLLRMAGAGWRPHLLSLSRGHSCSAGGSLAAPGRALALKKRGYDITRNPHLNKVGAAGGLSSRERRGARRGGGEVGHRRCPRWWVGVPAALSVTMPRVQPHAKKGVKYGGSSRGSIWTERGGSFIGGFLGSRSPAFPASTLAVVALEELLSGRSAFGGDPKPFT